MAPRPNWKGYLKLSLVSCPIALYPAISAAERVSFPQVDRARLHVAREKTRRIAGQAHPYEAVAPERHQSNGCAASQPGGRKHGHET